MKYFKMLKNKSNWITIYKYSKIYIYHAYLDWYKIENVISFLSRCMSVFLCFTTDFIATDVKHLRPHHKTLYTLGLVKP